MKTTASMRRLLASRLGQLNSPNTNLGSMNAYRSNSSALNGSGTVSDLMNNAPRNKKIEKLNEMYNNGNSPFVGQYSNKPKMRPYQPDQLPVAYARAEVGGQTFVGINQKARPYGDRQAEIETLVSEQVKEKILNSDKKPSKPGGDTFPNKNMATAHAEIFAMQKAYLAGLTQDDHMELTVEGFAVCIHCREDLVGMAKASGLISLVVYDNKAKRTFLWRRGMDEFTKLKGTSFDL